MKEQGGGRRGEGQGGGTGRRGEGQGGGGREERPSGQRTVREIKITFPGCVRGQTCRQLPEPLQLEHKKTV